jgi:hypothetical protein
MMPHRARSFGGWVRETPVGKSFRLIAALFVSSLISGVTPAEAQTLPHLRTTFVPRLLPEPNDCYMFSCFDRASYDGTTLAAIGTIEPIVHVYRRIPAGPWGAQGTFRNKTALPPGYDRAGYRYPLAVIGDDIVVTAFRSGPGVPELCETRVFGRIDTLWRIKQTINACAEQFAKDGNRILLSAGNSLTIYARGADGMFAQESRIVAPSEALFDGEKSLALHGWTVVVGKPGHNADTGAAYIFQRRNGTWSLARTLLPDGAGAARFGHAVGVYEYNVAVSAPRAIPPSGNGTGLIYIYTGVNDDWSLSQQIAEGVTTEYPVGNTFGVALNLRGQRLVISTTSPFDSGLGPPSYLFERGMRESDWVARATLAGNGVSIDLSGNTAMVDRRGPRGGTFPTVVNLPALREPEVAP